MNSRIILFAHNTDLELRLSVAVPIARRIDEVKINMRGPPDCQSPAELPIKEADCALMRAIGAILHRDQGPAIVSPDIRTDPGVVVDKAGFSKSPFDKIGARFIAEPAHGERSLKRPANRRPNAGERSNHNSRSYRATTELREYFGFSVKDRRKHVSPT